MICGGVARSKGDFWWTKMVLLRLAADAVLGVAELSVIGENVAYVGFGAPEGVELDASWMYAAPREGLEGRWWEAESSGSPRCDRGVDM